nr:ATP-binding cassette domain-containing protein [Streptococcus didelphis]
MTLHEVEKLAIIGEEGTGKSTLIQYINNPLSISTYAKAQGEYSHSFQNPFYIPQALSEEQLEEKLYTYIFDSDKSDYFDYNTFFQLANEWHFKCELLEDEALTLKDLSGGEKLKIQLLRALALQPDLLLLDEPTSDLDLQSLEWLERFIQNSPLTILFISHDETFLSHTATAILHLELPKKRKKATYTYFQGTYQDYLTNRKRQYEKLTQVAKKEKEAFEHKQANLRKLHSQVENQLRATKDSTAGRLLAKKMKNIKSQEKKLSGEKEKLTQLPDTMETINLFFSKIQKLAKQKIILKLEDFSLNTGQVINLTLKGQDKLIISGKNGIGKTSLLRIIYEHLKRQTHTKITYMPQNYEDFLDEKANVIDFLSPHNIQDIKPILASLQFTHEEIYHPTSQLSGGQKAKLF